MVQKSNNEKRWAFIVNPVAGNGHATIVADQLRARIAEKGINATIAFTERKGHATTLAKGFADEGYSHIIGVGGDGTFNEISSSLVNNPAITTGLVPAGTGNDFIQILGFPDRFTDKEWEIFFREETIAIDTGHCNGMPFFNGMGLGFDAQVAAENYTAPGEVKRGGKNKYIWHILKTLLFFREKRMVVVTGGQKVESDCFINTVAVGRRFAGGFYLTPGAIANDGLLDVCSVTKLSLPQRLKILMMVPKGTHINDKRVNYYQTGGLSLEFTGEVPYHVDGELYFSSHFEIGIIPASLNIIFNSQGPHYLYKPEDNRKI